MLLSVLFFMSTKKEMLAWHDLPPSLSYSVWRSNNVSPAAICAQHSAIILRTRFGFNHLISNKREYNNCFFRKKKKHPQNYGYANHICRPCFNYWYLMMVLPKKALELHYPMINFFSNSNCTMKTHYEPYCCCYFIYYKINREEKSFLT